MRGSARSSLAAAAAEEVNDEAVWRRGRGYGISHGKLWHILRHHRINSSRRMMTTTGGRARTTCSCRSSDRDGRGAQNCPKTTRMQAPKSQREADDEAATSDRVRGRERGCLRGADVEVEAANSPNAKKAKRIANTRRQLAILAAKITEDRRGDDEKKRSTGSRFWGKQ